MDSRNQKENIKEFVRRWSAQTGAEEEQDRSFWIEFMQDCLGVLNATKLLDFQRKVGGRKIDVFYEDMKILIEQKGKGIDLDKPSIRSKRVGEETPFQQAKWYADNMPNSIRPDWIITCNFDEFRIYDLNHPENGYVQVLLQELPDQIHLFSFFTDKSNSRLVKEKELSVRAGELVGELYKALSAQYQNIEEDAAEQRSLNILIVRLVFLLYAEDSDLLATKQQLGDFLENTKVEDIRGSLIELFKVLDTPVDKRNTYIKETLKDFPYVNGGLFSEEDIIIPQFTDEAKRILVKDCSVGFNWSKISPTIFGAAFESTLNPETRRSGGMHYTSIENIHKVINPLFLDDLKAELAEIEGEKVQKKRKFKLLAFQNKLASIKILDPAAGSGNFLTESFIQLRKLENRVLENLKFIDDANNPSPQIMATEQFQVKVSISQFLGIEINDFAVSVAKTALWIAEEQMLDQTAELLFLPFDFLPLSSNSNIICTNALRTNWSDLLPAEDCTYIIGNPPFIGHQWRSVDQQEDMAAIFGNLRGAGKLDYVCAWFEKARIYAGEQKIHTAFVATNSICQGESVGVLWKHMAAMGVQINFAHKSFVWDSEASDMAHVHVVIVGFSHKNFAVEHKQLFLGAEKMNVEHINGYLAAASDVFIQNRGRPVNAGAPEMTKGSQPTDGGNLILSEEERDELVSKHPELEDVIHQYMGGQEFLNGNLRYCLWFDRVNVNDYLFPEIQERLNLVKESRLNSPTASVRENAQTPHLFTQIRQPETAYIAVPEVSSERRIYLPIGYNSPDIIASNKLRFIPSNSKFILGILLSKMHNVWMRTIAGRLEMRYSYSPAVYNSYIFPDCTDEQKRNIENCAQGVLDVRASHPNKTLADLYDPDLMPQDLLSAHKALDAAVEEAYGVNFNGDEEKIVGHLFKLYEGLTNP